MVNVPPWDLDIPDKKYYTIGEVSEMCQLKSHVLRYWEQVFPQLNPNKRRGRRYYQKEDLVLLLEIKTLLHDQGFTISGAKARLSQTTSRSQDLTPPVKTLSSRFCVANDHEIQIIKEELAAFKDYLQQSY
ncbi:MerR family transcriptional regulator [Thiomicrospira microaerophila]|uniref:MerR family transcriptional regulator n=1 Tax=Thiomicrospira microaerophila TaxID=406020 RepID=UPI0005CA3E4C|nr:MerR family transcriptional regulator [Thiomicrospira microaerophila]